MVAQQDPPLIRTRSRTADGHLAVHPGFQTGVAFDAIAARAAFTPQVCTWIVLDIRVNDPSAGSPTETLLRLLLPLGDKVH